MMRFLDRRAILGALLLLFLTQVSITSANGGEDEDEMGLDGDFDEFDAQMNQDHDDETEEDEAIHSHQIKKDEESSKKKQQQQRAEMDFEEDEATVIDDDDDNSFNHFEDEEEFENFETFKDDDDEFINENKKGAKKKDKSSSHPPPPPPKTINITKVPAHLRTRWENYVLEILMVVGVLVYVINFFNGKAKNQKIANAWFNSHKSMLENNFALVGDDGSKNVDDIETQVQKEAEHIFMLWCSGRVCCEGMLVELKLLKRQDLVSVISHMIKPAMDQVQVTVNMNPEDMDSFVFALALRKTAVKMSKELTDINTYCHERRSAEKHGVPVNYLVMSEIAEVTAAMLDPKMIAVLNKYENVVDSVHFSDQYTGPKPTDADAAQQTSRPDSKKVLIFNFNVVLKKNNRTASLEDTMENLKPMMMLVFYFMDKIKRFRLTREGKNKADKNRSKVSEAYWKSIHAAKAEKAQEERERKRREIKERILEIEDPTKQRKLEDRENRRERKKAAPKMKQLKVKAM